MEKYKNKYRVESNRLKGYNYASEGVYFLTICVKNFLCEFGKIENDAMILNDFGKIVEAEWKKSEIIRKEIKLGAFCVMPNHFHSIVTIGNPILPEKSEKLPQTKGYISDFRAEKHSISALMIGFKSSSNRQIQKSGNKSFEWQPNYYDHIIRDIQEFNRIENYIKTNPQSWNKDKFYKSP